MTQIGCYALHLYCDGVACRSSNGFDTSKTFGEFTGETAAGCRKSARQAGWLLKAIDLCPKCSGRTPSGLAVVAALILAIGGCATLRPITCDVARAIVERCDAQGLAPAAEVDGVTCEIARAVLADCATTIEARCVERYPGGDCAVWVTTSAASTCGDNSPARPAPSFHLGAELWSQFQPMDHCPGAQCSPLPDSRDESDWASTRTLQGFFDGRPLRPGRLVGASNAGITLWRTDLIEGRPVLLRSVIGWHNICAPGIDVGCFLAFPEPGENEFYIDEAAGLPIAGGEAVLALSGRSTVGVTLWRLEAPAAGERLRILYQDLPNRSTAVDVLELGGRYAVACGVLGCYVYDLDAALALPAPCLDDGAGSCGVRLGEIGDGESFAVTTSLTSALIARKGVHHERETSQGNSEDGEAGGLQAVEAVVVLEMQGPSGFGDSREKGSGLALQAFAKAAEDLGATIYSRAVVHGGSIWLLAGTSFSAELWRVDPLNPGASELVWSTTDTARGVTLWSDGVRLYGAAVIAQGVTRTVKFYDFSLGGAPELSSFDVSGSPLATKDYLSSGEGWVYYAPATSFAGPGRLVGAYRERFFDVSAPPVIEMLPRGETFTGPCNGQQVDYWGFMYPGNDLGTRNLLPHRGSFVGGIFYRSAFGVFDGHRMPPHQPPENGEIFVDGFESGDLEAWQ